MPAEGRRNPTVVRNLSCALHCALHRSSRSARLREPPFLPRYDAVLFAGPVFLAALMRTHGWRVRGARRSR